MSEHEERLTPAEREALRELSATPPTPPELEARTIEALARRGAIERAPSRRSGSWRWIAIAASVATFVVGLSVGRASRQSAPVHIASSSYMLLLYEDERFDPGPGGQSAEYAAWGVDLVEGGRTVFGAELGPEAIALPVREAAPALAHEARLAGFFVIEARDLNEAVAVASSVPHLKYGGEVVVRPLR